MSYDYFLNRYKLNLIDLAQQSISLDKQQIDFIGKLEEDATVFFNIEETKKKQPLNFHKIFLISYKMEGQKINNFLKLDDNTEKYFQTKKW